MILIAVDDHHPFLFAQALAPVPAEMAMRVEKKGKGKRKAVPTALRSELEEYSFLLRALRTNDTLDLSSQLIRAAGSSQASEDGDVHDRSFTPAIGGSGSDLYSRKPKDIWTRWPLLIQDVPIPEWSLQDEVERLANKFLEPPGDPDEETEEEPIDSTTVKHLTLETTEHLSRLFAIIAAHVPVVTESMQNRLRPLNWENVLAIVGASGLVDPRCGFYISRRVRDD